MRDCIGMPMEINIKESGGMIKNILDSIISVQDKPFKAGSKKDK